MTLDQIGKFEKMNNLSINVYSEKEEVILPVRVSKEKKERHFNLLYIEDVSGCGIGHFAWIKNLSRLVNSQLNSDGHKKYICDRCLHYFPTIDKLQFHEVDCGVINDCAVRLPAENDKWLEFTNANRKERLPFVVYADLECILEKTSAEEREKNKIATLENNIPTKKLIELKVGIDHPIHHIRSVKTKFGKRYIANIGDQFTVFLPGRLYEAFDQNEDEFEKLLETA
ncbi:uncharacterized protein [Venturia canescens]|uniref:uncharacterized protein n=1 Tax=Venturia canescens TaxID=32260 RepID=UPI001C9CB3C5|nr:uncharacterized protein LOC122411410 [Venturia canescens]